MTSRVILQMLLPPKYSFKRLLKELLQLLLRMEALTRKLPSNMLMKYYQDWNNESIVGSSGIPSQSWDWFLDMERTCSHLVGRLIGDMIRGPPLSSDEERSLKWLNSRVLKILMQIMLCSKMIKPFILDVFTWPRRIP